MQNRKKPAARRAEATRVLAFQVIGRLKKPESEEALYKNPRIIRLHPPQSA
jgi:hypothetical protein